ncbi:MAG: hypothetical protein II631_03435, partial [Treponema sp.]|nr:hypothetical protein [Treponema sp.]
MLPSSFPAEQETRLSVAAKTKAAKAGIYLNILKTEKGKRFFFIKNNIITLPLKNKLDNKNL